MPKLNKQVKYRNDIFWYKISMILALAAGIVAFTLLVYLYMINNIQVEQSRTDVSFTCVNNYSCREIMREDTPIGVIKEYTFPLNESIVNDTHLAFYTVHQYVEVYLGGQKIYSLKPSEENRMIKTVGSNWVVIPLYREDAGKEIRVEITPVYESFRNREVEFLVGSQLAIYVNRLSKDLPQLILSIMAVFVGFIFLCIAGYILFQKNTENRKGLAALGLFSIMMGCWRLTDTRFTPFIVSDKPLVLFYISVTMLMLGMIPLIKSIEERMNRLSSNILEGYCIVATLVSLIQLLLQIFGLMDIRNCLFVTHILIVVGAGIIIGNVIYDRYKYPNNNQKRMERRLPLICVVGVLADVVAFYIRGTSSGLLFSLLAFLLYIVFSGIAMMYRYSKQEKELAEKDRLLAENERQLTESRIATMMSQIQPHFIYNTLGTIGQFCLEDPAKASDLVQQFSLYLRGNFTELRNSAPIRISREIEHVQHYAYIEQVRFPDIQIEYELKAGDFLIPALSVQPLVENAIKHGLMGLESGGTVRISTYETDEAYYVSVQDDGVGFEQSVFAEDDKHIGIRNIRGRIEAMCGGTLVIESTPGMGTTARIMLPKEGVNR